MEKLKILYLEDNPLDVELVGSALKSSGILYRLIHVSSGNQFKKTLKKESFGIVLCDYSLPDINGLEALKYVQDAQIEIPFIFVSGTLGEESAIETLKRGATDYVLKQKLSRLAPAIRRAVKESNERAERKQAEESLKASEQRYRTLVEGSGQSINTINQKGEILFANSVSKKQWSKNGDKLIGKTIQDVFPESLADSLMDKINKVIEKQKAVIEVCDVLINKQVKWFEWRIFPLTDNGLGDKSALLISMDVTARKSAEERLKQSYDQLQKTLYGIVNALTSTIEIRDSYTAGHQRRVAELACMIAAEMDLPEDKIEGIRIASLMHDIGKIYVPTEILSKPSRLTESEFNLIKIHPQAGYNILKSIEFPWPVAEIIQQHHEKIDGSGYPKKMKGDKIIIEARIICVADVLETMASHRPYRPAKGLKQAIEEITQNRGKFYDPKVVDICLKLYKKRRLNFLE